jgi:dUTP pyrophosphatase
MKVKIKKLHKDAVIPKYAKPGDAGMDLTAIEISYDNNGNIVYRTGLSFEIPAGFFMMLVPRSSNSKTNLMLTNHCGIVDSGYRGEVMFKYKPYKWNDNSQESFLEMVKFETYKIGDRVGQGIILPYPQIEFEEVEELSVTERNTGGYGSSGA